VRVYLLLFLLVFGNCYSVQKQDSISQIGEDMVCEEENPSDCKYQFENY
jgi:hypothetical protein